MMRPLTLVCALVLCAGPFVSGIRAQTPVVVITNAHVLPGEGAAIENATLVIRDGRIASLSGAAPEGATVIDAAGKIVTPGFISTETALGLVEIDLEDSTRNAGPEDDDADPVRAAFSAADGVNPASTLIRVARRYGVTSAITVPTGGLISGRGALIDLAGRTPDSMVAARDVSLHVNLDDGGVSATGGAFPMALTRFREVLADARLYGQNERAFERRGLRELNVSGPDLAALQPALAGNVPVVVRVSRAADILRVLALKESERVNIVLSGAEEGWRVAEEIAAADVPVIVHPLENLPSTFTRIGARFDNARLLAEAGARIILTAPGAHDVRNLRQEAGNAIANGLSREAVLRAITVEPARVFGQADRGAIAVGQVANVVVWDGDPFELTSAPTDLIIGGRVVTLRNRQTRLLERYRRLESVRRGPPRAAPAPTNEAAGTAE